MLKYSLRWLLLIILVVALAPLPQAQAATITVNTDNDDIDALDGDCTLREAIIAANTDTASGAAAGECIAGAGDDEIVFGPWASHITLTANLPTITSNIDINGPGAASLAIDGAGSYREFTITGNTVNITGVSIQSGDSASGTGITVTGGAILTITDSSITDNLASAGSGGGLYIDSSTVTINNSSVSNNSSNNDGGCIYVTGAASVLNINNSSTIDSNDIVVSTGGLGGAIYLAAGTTTIDNSSVSSNFADADGGGIYVTGGAILNILNNSTIDTNDSNFNDGSGIHINNGIVTIDNSTVSNSVRGYDGSGIYVAAGGTLTVTNSEMSGNTASHFGGGIYNGSNNTNITNSIITGNQAQIGGGLYLTNGTTVTNSLIANNQSSQSGGGIRKLGGNLVLINNTISGNTATNEGGGIYVSLAGQTELYNVTITSNTANGGSGGGGVSLAGGATFQTWNTIISGNTDGSGTGHPDCSDNGTGGFNSQGYNLVGDTAGCGAGAFTAVGDVAPGVVAFGALAANGALTPPYPQTHALISGSAIDGGNPAGCDDGSGGTLAVDQRWRPRPLGTACDMGAYETQPLYGSTPAPGTTIDSGTALIGSSTTATLVISNIGDGILTVSNPTITGPNAAVFSVTGIASPVSILGGASVNAGIQCTPDVAGTLTATLTFDTNDASYAPAVPANPVTYSLTCTGTVAPTPVPPPPPPPPTPVPPPPVPGDIYPYREYLNLRPAPTGNPSENAENVITQMYEGDVVEVYSTTPVCLDGFTWYHLRLIGRIQEDGTITPVENPPTGWAAGKIRDTLTIRGTLPANPCCNLDISANASEILLFETPNGQIKRWGLEGISSLTAVGQYPGWWLVQIGWISWEEVNLQGWVSSEAVIAEGNCAAVPAIE